MTRIFLLTLWMMAVMHAKSQESRFIQHDLGDANYNVTINVMLQDHNGMIWLGADNGLARYDGARYDEVRLSADNEYKITALFEDHLHRIWVGTEAGEIFYLDPARRAIRFEIEEGPSIKKRITGFVEDHAYQLWFATYGEGVYVYNGKRLTSINVDDGLSGDDVYTIVHTPQDEVWVATDDGISICSYKNELKDIKRLGADQGLPDQIITALESDSKGNVLIGTFESGVAIYDRASGNVVIPFSNPGLGQITTLEIFDGSEIWIGTEAKGVWRFRMGLNQVSRVQNLKFQEIKSVTYLLSDVEGNIWVAMKDNGLISGFRPFESVALATGDVQSIFCDHADQVWLGTTTGLYKLEKYTDATTKAIRMASSHHLDIRDILEDRFHQLWIGTINKGLFIYEPERDKLTHISTATTGPGVGISAMAMSSDKIWISTNDGIRSYPAAKDILHDTRVFEPLNSEWDSKLHFIYDIFVDSKDRIWIGTSGNGVFCKTGDQMVQHYKDDTLRMHTVLSICEDDDGDLWFNVQEQGIVEFDGTHYWPLDIEDGMRNMDILSMFPSGSGDFVLVHNRGIDIMEEERHHFMYYSDEIGAKDIEPSMNSIARDQQGQIYIGCNNRIFSYFVTDPKLSIHPRTLITEVSVFENPIDFAHDSTFTHSENYFTFKYAGLWYTSPSSVKYSYMLENYDLNWIESKDNTAAYSHLGPGHYTFYVKASENKSFLDEPVTHYSFYIAKPFWMEAWFIVPVALALAGLLFWLVKSREKRSQRQANLKKEMAESQLSAIKAQINPHFLFNSFNTLITIIDENAMKPHVAIEYVEKLSDFYRSILQYREQESISLEDEYELVRNFTYLLEKRYGNHLRVHMDKAPSDAFILPLTLQILVENAVKHNVISAQKPLDVYIAVESDGYVSVRNNLQLKSSSDPSTQFGLSSIIKQYHFLSEQKVEVLNDDKQFVVRIPLIKRSNT